MDKMFKKIFVCLLFTGMLHATVTLTDKNLEYDNFSIHYFYDESTKLDINDIETTHFDKVIPNQFSEGYYEGTAWFKIELTNRSKNKDFVLSQIVSAADFCSSFKLTDL